MARMLDHWRVPVAVVSPRVRVVVWVSMDEPFDCTVDFRSTGPIFPKLIPVASPEIRPTGSGCWGEKAAVALHAMRLAGVVDRLMNERMLRKRCALVRLPVEVMLVSEVDESNGSVISATATWEFGWTRAA